MRLLIQAIIFSVLIHLIYLSGNLIYGWYLTYYYIPDVVKEYENVTYLQNEVVFGYVIRPFSYVVSFVLLTIIGVVVIVVWKKIYHSRRSV